MHLQEFFYDNYLGDNPEIESELIRILTMENAKVGVDGPTGSGKTTLIMNILDKLEGMQKYLKDYPSDPKELKSKMKAMQKRHKELHDIAYHQVTWNDEADALKNLSKDEEDEYNFLCEKIKYYNLAEKGELNLEEINKFRYIFLVPTRVLSSQVAKKNKTSELTGGMTIKESDSIVTATYDNINKAMSATKKNILIIDEAHKLVSDNNFRKKALDAIREAEKQCFSVMHITATPRPLLNFYNYKYFIKMSPNNPDENKNVRKLTLVDIPKEDRIHSLISFIQDKFSKDKRLIIRVNSKKIIKQVVETLSAKNLTSGTDFKIGIACNKETMRKLELKHLDVTTHIQEKELIPENVNIVLATSILDVGASIKNNNLTLVYFSKDASDLKQDDIKQFFARARIFNEEAYLLTCNLEEGKIKPIEQIELEVSKDISQVINGFNLAIDGLKMMFNDDKKTLIKSIKAMLNTSDLKGNLVNQGCIFLNEDDLTLEVSAENKRANILNKFDSQLFYNINALKTFIEDDLKAKHIELCEMYYHKDKPNEDEELKEVKKASRREAREKGLVAVELIAAERELGGIKTLIELNEVKSKNNLEVDNFKENIQNKELLEKIEILENFNPLQKALKSCKKIGLSTDETVEFIFKHGYRDEDIKYHLLRRQFIEINNNPNMSKWDNKVTQTYLIIRKHTKTALKNRTTVSKKHQLWMYQELLANKLIKPLKIEKLLESHQEFKQFKQKNTNNTNNIYLEYLIQEYTKHKPRLPVEVVELFNIEIIKLLSLIYALDNEYRISNLIK